MRDLLELSTGLSTGCHFSLAFPRKEEYNEGIEFSETDFYTVI